MKSTARVLGPILAVFAGAWLVVASCARDARSAPRAVTISTRDDNGEPLAEVAIEASGRVLGTTDAHGRLQLVLRPKARLAARCPEAYRPAPAQQVALADRRNALTFVCRPRLRTIAIVVSAPAARGLVLRADAQSLGRVDDQGLLHAVLKRAPGTTLSLSLLARGAPPDQAFATRTLEVEDRDRIVLFDPESTGR